MTESRDQGSSKDASEIHATKSSSPSKHTASSVVSREASSKTSKKRRKVNHGEATLLCILKPCTPLLIQGHLKHAYTADVR